MLIPKRSSNYRRFTGIDNVETNPKDIEIVLDNKSKNHHYIPIYYIKGFTDSDNLLWYYDKKYDRICSKYKRRSPASLFYQVDGNTVEFDGNRTTLAETLSQKVDDLHVRSYRKILALEDVRNIDGEQCAFLSLHSFSQFVRNPQNDWLYDVIVKSFEKWPQTRYRQLVDPSMLTLEFFRKTMRFGLPVGLYEILTRDGSGTWSFRLYRDLNSSIVLSDQPVVYLKPIIRMDDLLGPCVIALSKDLLFFRDVTDSPIGQARNKVAAYNLIALEKAERYVCAASQDILELLVNAWKEPVIKKLLREPERLFHEL